MSESFVRLSDADVAQVEQYVDANFERFQGNQLRIMDALRNAAPEIREEICRASGLSPEDFELTIKSVAAQHQAAIDDPTLRENLELP